MIKISSEYYDEELELIKRRRMAELMRRAEEAKAREEELIRELQKQEVLRRVLSPEARERLANIKLIRPELARALEEYLVNLALSGRLSRVIDDDELKEILRQGEESEEEY